MQPKKFSPIKKIKQNPKKKSPINKSLDKYREFISEKKDIPKSKNKKVIQVKRKRLSPKVKKNNIQDINDIEQKLLEIKDTKIKMPTQNIKITSEIKPRIIDKSESKISKIKAQPKLKVQPKIKKPNRSNRRSSHRKKSRGRKVSIKSRVFNEKM